MHLYQLPHVGPKHLYKKRRPNSKTTSCEQVQKEVFWLSGNLRQALQHWLSKLILLLTLPLSLGSDLSQADRNCLVVKSDSWKDINFKDTLVHGRCTSQVHNPQTWKTPPPGCTHLRFLTEALQEASSVHTGTAHSQEPSSSPGQSSLAFVSMLQAVYMPSPEASFVSYFTLSRNWKVSMHTTAAHTKISTQHVT